MGPPEVSSPPSSRIYIRPSAHHPPSAGPPPRDALPSAPPGPWAVRPRQRGMHRGAGATPRSRGPRPPSSAPAPTGQFRVCRKIECVESFCLSTVVLRAPGLLSRSPTPSPSTGECHPPRRAVPHPPASLASNWQLAARRATSVPSPPQPGGPPPRSQDARTRGRGMPGRFHHGPSAWPGPSCLVIPLPTRPLRLARRRSPPPSRAPLARWLLASLYTLRPHLGQKRPSKP